MPSSTYPNLTPALTHHYPTHFNPPQRTIALRTTSAGGRVEQSNNKEKAKKQRTDQWEALREVQMQTEQMRNLEDVLVTLCQVLGIDAGLLLDGIDASLAMN